MSEADLSPQEVRARLEHSYKESYRRMGLNYTDEAIAQEVNADLELVDAAKRIGEIKEGVTVEPDRFQAREKPEEIIRAEIETGTRVLDDQNRGEIVRSVAMDANPQFTSERWSYAGARISRILEGAGGSSDVSKAVQNAAIPHLAREYIELWFNFTRRDPWGVIDRKNPFDSMNDVDALKKLVRMVEDICDRSTGYPSFGAWYTK